MASQQPPARPWFRLASVSRPTQAPAPAPAPAPARSPAPPQAQALPVAQPRPPIIPSTFTQPLSNPPTQPAQLPLAPPTQAPTPLPVAAAPPPRATAPPPAPALNSPPPQPATAPPAAAFPQIPTAPPPRATAPPPAPALKSPSPPPRAAATPPSPVSSAPPSAPTSTPSPNAISSQPRVKPEQPVTIAANSERTVKPLARPEPSPSPKMKPLTSPPSPLTLPAAQLKSHLEHQDERPKAVLVQETVEKHMVMPSNGQNRSTDITRRDGKPDVRKDNGNYKKQSDSEEFRRRVITVAGENKGAVMEWIPSNKKNSPASLHKNGGSPRTWSDGEKHGSERDSGNEEGRGKGKEKSHKARTNSSQPMNSFMNSNVQGVNNSILYNCSYSHHDPGVHFSLSRKANGHGNGVNHNNKDHANHQNI